MQNGGQRGMAGVDGVIQGSRCAFRDGDGVQNSALKRKERIGMWQERAFVPSFHGNLMHCSYEGWKAEPLAQLVAPSTIAMGRQERDRRRQDILMRPPCGISSILLLKNHLLWCFGTCLNIY